MPDGAVPRALEYVLLLFTACLASTFVWWLAAWAGRAEYRRLLSALACSMRWFFYAICLLSILVAVQALGYGPKDPRSLLMGWIHIGGSILVSIPCAWRAFRTSGARLALIVALAWIQMALLGALAISVHPGVREILVQLPRYLARG